MKFPLFLFLYLLTAQTLAANFLSFSCERAEKTYAEKYDLKIIPATKSLKAKVYLDDRDLDHSDGYGRQWIKNVVITEATVLISMETAFPSESFDGIVYGMGSVVTVININRLTGQLRKVETVSGGILSATLGDGTKSYEEKCSSLGPLKP
jgi:hypothetical protein